MTMEISCATDGVGSDWTVRVGDRYSDHLDRGEALVCVAYALLVGFDKAGLKTAEEHATFQAWMARPLIDASDYEKVQLNPGGEG